MKIIRMTLQIIVFLFFAAYLLSLETGRKVQLQDIVRLLPQSQQRDTISPKPSPIERMKEIDHKS